MPEGLIDALEAEIKNNPDASLSNYRAGLIKAIEIAKEVDAVRVAHGHWDYTEEDGYELYECSVCGKKSYEYSADYPYCPMCGAKMDEEDDYED